MAPISASRATAPQLPLDVAEVFPAQALAYPEFRYMGSKHRLLPWIHSVLSDLKFETAADPFSGGGSVSYLLKAMGKRVASSDFLNFPSVIASALVANQATRVSPELAEHLVVPRNPKNSFIQKTFQGIFFHRDDLAFLDQIWESIDELEDGLIRHLVLTALIRSAMKRQPRGVFTVGNLPDGTQRYDDGRRDVRLSLREHFLEQIQVMNRVVFDGPRCTSSRRDALQPPDEPVDLVYLDPPYVPRADDNCYVKRYHFLEGLSNYWRGMEILPASKVKKLVKPATPFSHRSSAVDAFRTLFRAYADSTIVLSYSSNGYPDLNVLVSLLKETKKHVEVDTRAHRYHFGTHRAVQRSETTEYLIVGTN
jgi:DNA adenine methylase/adenine-specific DNA-methyltransferase